MEETENGVRRVVWIPNDLDLIIEKTRQRLGLNRSAFYKYAMMQLLQQLSVLSSSIKKEEVDGDG